MDVLGPGAEYITEMTQQIQSSLNLLLFLKERYGEHELFLKCKESMIKKEGLFEHLLLAFKTADESLDQQITDSAKQQVGNVEAEAASLKTS